MKKFHYKRWILLLNKRRRDHLIGAQAFCLYIFHWKSHFSSLQKGMSDYFPHTHHTGSQKDCGSFFLRTLGSSTQTIKKKCFPYLVQFSRKCLIWVKTIHIPSSILLVVQCLQTAVQCIFAKDCEITINLFLLFLQWLLTHKFSKWRKTKKHKNLFLI